ncbi:radical SAM/SPASM domain-containing protein [Staphylococcus nepalensis]|uniref:radical SAM/SPASM domain-containing protein n=1 Tax=Staphylococcus nepalensis TaxID=214473 RepID=UPI0024BBD420|nr:radical SAM protein [Staphylococcus nepalensis]
MIKSKNLHVIEKDDTFYVFHKKFGNLTLMSRREYQLLNNLDLEIENKKEILNIFSENYFINECDKEENENIELEINNRNDASDGRLLIGLQLIVSNFCNFNCKYCFLNEEHKLRDNSEKNAPSDMKLDVAKKAINFMIENIKKNGNKILSIEFFGGEPLMNWRLIKEVLDFYGNGEKSEIAIEYTITTNGSLITNEVIDYFEKYNVHTIISFDSPNSHERITKNRKDLNEVLVPIFEKLHHRNITISFNSVISKYTLENFDYKGLVDISEKYNIQNIGLILDLDVDLLGKKINLDDIINLILKTYYEGRSRGINVTGYWEKMFLQINNQEDLFYEKGYKACPAVGCKISVEPSGDIFACKCCPTKIGEIDRAQNMLIDNEYREYLDKVYKNSDMCHECELEGFCSGVCVGSLEKNGSKYGRNSNLCYVYKKITEELIKGISRDEISTDILQI